ncbi:hypothetical protein PVAND_010080 [Polypedilum vanderplanki]|uniref:protein-serine/threonine phosphatase n=1 Tax=Polypedilum vanderplanki TaxID=319348 RepID=A0A9J6CF88_POLVA|nr:hypothetical protein PVAND_010080 [Polypedilum vanderplanki]
MGQTLSEPVTAKETAICQDDNYKVGSSCMQGWRTSMEDAHSHILSLPDDPSTAWFSVFDGHGGGIVAKYASKHLHKYVIQRPEFPDDIPVALMQGFLDIDTAMQNDDQMKEQMAGSTAVCCLIRENKLYCANSGDSRAIACRNGQLVTLSNDHKPNLPEEMERIYNAGGWVEFNRVNGNLALSRALGDFLFKRNHLISAEKQIVTALPEVTVHDLSEEWDFIVLGCDGIWDVLTNQAVINFVIESIAEGKYPENICEELLTYCLAPVCQMGGLGGDNMTIIIVCCLHEKPWENLVEKCKKYHADKKAMSKLHEPAFNTFDRFATTDGPFSEVLKAGDDSQNVNDTSSSSHTSSPSSSPISAEEKFDGLTTVNQISEEASINETKNSNDQDSPKNSTSSKIVDNAVNPVDDSNVSTAESAVASNVVPDSSATEETSTETVCSKL